MIAQGLRLIVTSSLIVITPSFAGCMRDLAATGSAGTVVTIGQAAKDRLLKNIQALRNAPYVEVRGTSTSVGDDKLITFHLLMGPAGELALRCGQMAIYCDGKQLAGVDFSTAPPTRILTTEGPGLADGASMGLYHVLGGPFPIALAKLFDERTWLAVVTNQDDRAVFEERQLAGDRCKICVTVNQGEQHQFIFAGPRAIPVSYAWYSRDSRDKPMYLQTIERVTFPKSISGNAFTAP